jgi:hypothetical protein
MSEQSRNDLCACGSGKKYKKCCYLTKIAAPAQPGFAEADKAWRFHKSRCEICAIGKTYEAPCEVGKQLYSTRVNAPDAAVRLRVPKPGTE